MLVRILAFDGKHKLSNKWEEDPYIVTDQPNNDIPVYVVKKEDGTGRVRTLHRNHLLPIGYIRPRPVPVPRRKARAQLPDLGQHAEVVRNVESSPDDLDSVSSEEMILVQEPEVEDAENTATDDNTSVTDVTDTVDGNDVEYGDALEDSTSEQPGTDGTEDDEPPTHQDGATPSSTPRRSSRDRKLPEWMRRPGLLLGTTTCCTSVDQTGQLFIAIFGHSSIVGQKGRCGQSYTGNRQKLDLDIIWTLV